MGKSAYEELQQKVKDLEKTQKKNNSLVEKLKAKEQELCRNKELLVRTIENAQIGIVTVNRNGRFRSANESFCKMIGYSLEEFLKMSVNDLTHPDYISKTSELRKKLWAGKIDKFELEKKYVCKNGDVINGFTKVSIISDCEDNPAFELAEIEDVTDLRKTEKALKNSEIILNMMINNAPDIIYRLNEHGEILFINNAITEYGYTPEELSGTNIIDIIHPDDREKAAYRIGERRTGERSTKNLELRLLKKDKSSIQFEERSIGIDQDPVIIVNAEGYYETPVPESDSFLGTLGVGRDISIRKQKEENLRESNEKFRALTENSSDIIMRFDKDHRHIYVNSAVTNVVSFQPEEMLNKTHRELGFPEEMCEYWENRISRVFSTKRPVNETFELEDNETKIVFDWRLIPEYQSDGKVGSVLSIARDITKQKEAEIELRDSEAKYQAIFNNIQDVYFEETIEGKVLEISPSCENLFGVSRNEIINSSLIDFYADPNERKKFIKELDKSGRVINFRITVENKDGDIRYCSVNAILLSIFKKDKQESKIVGSIRDITDLKLADIELNKSIKVSEDIKNAIPSGLYIYDYIPPDKLFLVDGNPAAAAQTGVYAKDWIGKEFNEIWPEASKFKLDLLHVAKTGKLYDTEELNYKDNKLEGAFRIRSFEMPENRIGVAFENITTRKRAEEEYKKFRTIADNANYGTLICDFQGNIIYANNTFTKCCCIDENGSDYGNIFSFIKKDQVNSLKKSLQELKKTSGFETKEVWFVNNRGEEFPTLVNAYTISGEANSPLLIAVTVIDITERQKSFKEKKTLEEQLFHAQKMESIGRMAGGVAHDFNNILVGIMGYAELLKIQFSDPETSEGQAAEVILKGAERAADLTTQLLSFSRKGKFNPAPLNINNEILDTMQVSEKIFEKNIEVKYLLDENIHNIEADRHQINQVITNLIINSRDAMPKGGEITFKTENIVFDQEFVIKNPEFKTGKYVKVSISDTGVGMSEEVKNHAFEPFFSTKGESEGTGLGLASVYGIIKNHGGYINLFSSPGEGVTFNIYFPGSEKTAVEEKEEMSFLNGDATILVVDDEENVRQLAQKILKKMGYKVLIAKDGIEGVSMYQQYKNNIDLVVLDLIMPNMAGKETFDMLKKIDPEVKVLLSSGYSQEGKAVDMIKKGAKGFIQKPFRIKEISKAVSEVLKGIEN
ncbi:PAS domain S-box protein [candidate division KSB1 bacterium]